MPSFFPLIVDRTSRHLVSLFDWRLKQLYDKFDDVVASGRMIAKISDTADGNTSSSLANGKKKNPSLARLCVTDTINLSLVDAFVMYCSSTFARVSICMHIYSHMHPLVWWEKVRRLLPPNFFFVVGVVFFFDFFTQTPRAYKTKKEREKESTRNMRAKWCSIDLSRTVWMQVTWLAAVVRMPTLFFSPVSFIANVFYHYCWPLIEMEDHICFVLTQASAWSKV